LFCDADKLQVLCHTCHDSKSLQSKLGCTFDEALLEKRVIAQLKKKAETLDILKKNGYSGVEVSNETKRRNLLRQILKEKENE